VHNSNAIKAFALLLFLCYISKITNAIGANMHKIQNTNFTIYTNKNFKNSIFIKTNLKNNLTYMCSSMQKVALCLQAHNLKNATVRILTKRFNNACAKKLAQAAVIRIANA